MCKNSTLYPIQKMVKVLESNIKKFIGYATGANQLLHISKIPCSRNTLPRPTEKKCIICRVAQQCQKSVTVVTAVHKPTEKCGVSVELDTIF